MRTNNNTIYIQPNYSQNRNPVHQQFSQFNRSYEQIESSIVGSRISQKTEQRKIKFLSPSAIQLINQQIYKIINMDPYIVETNLNYSAKNIHGLINNQLLLSIKSASNMKLLLYNVMLMYIDEVSKNDQQKAKTKQREKSYSLSSSRNVDNVRQKDQSLQMQVTNLSSSQQLQNGKQRIPFIPKVKVKIPRNSQVQMMEEQLSNKIQSTRQSLQGILMKVQHYSNYRLNGQDIMRLKRSVMDVSQLKPSDFLNSHGLNATSGSKTSAGLSRGQSREGRNPAQKQVKIRNNSRSKTCSRGQGNSPMVQETVSGEQGNQLLIQQLQQIIQRKQSRIKQLARELTKNLQDQKYLQGTVQRFELQIEEMSSEMKNLDQIIENLQQENLNYQLEIREFQENQELRVQTSKLRQSQCQEDSSHYNYLKHFQTRQKILRFNLRKQFQYRIQPSPPNFHVQTYKDLNNIQSSDSAFNDISEITPKRQGKKLPTDIDDEYLLQNNVITTRRNIATQGKQKTKDRSLIKYQIIGDRTQNKQKSDNSLEFTELEKQTFQKFIFLQALTIEQLFQDL